MRALCLSLFLSVSLSLFSQITVTVENTPLRAALKKIEQVSDYKFFYNEKLAPITGSPASSTIVPVMVLVFWLTASLCSNTTTLSLSIL